MNRMVLALALAGSVALAGCSSDKDASPYDTAVPLDKMTTEQWCAYYAKFLTNPQLTPQARATDIQRMKSRGCATPAS